MHFAEDRVDSPVFIKEVRDGVLFTASGSFLLPTLLTPFDSPSSGGEAPSSGMRESPSLTREGRGGLGGFPLDLESVEHLATFAPELILFGTGNTQIFPAPALMAPLYQKRIGFEVMNTPAACRTFNLLIAEGRNVLGVFF